MSAKCSQTALIAASDRVKLPLAVMTVEFCHDNGSLDGGILAQIEAHQLLTVILVDDTAVGIGYHAEILAAGIRLIDRYGKSDFFDLCRYLGKIYLYLLIVAVTITGTVITHMNDCAGCMLLVVVENEILFTAALSICSGHKYGYIQVKIMTAVIAVSIPSESYKDLF